MAHLFHRQNEHIVSGSWGIASAMLQRNLLTKMTRLGIRAKPHFALHQCLALTESRTEQGEHNLTLRRQQQSIKGI